MIRARIATEEDKVAWNDFCAEMNTSYGAFFQWYAFLQNIGITALFLLAEDERACICGCLPLCIYRNVNATICVSTLADGITYGGPLIKTPQATPALLELAEKEMLKRGVAYVSFLPDPLQPLIKDVHRSLLETGYNIDKYTDDPALHYCTFRMQLVDFKSVWLNDFHSKIRNQVRKAIKMGVKFQERDIDVFIHPYQEIQTQVWKRLGNMAPDGERLYQTLKMMGNMVITYLAEIDDKVVGGLYCYRAGRGFYLKGAVTRDDYRQYCVGNLMYARSIEDACKAGAAFYDMGITPPLKESGHYLWKSRYGATAYPIIRYNCVFNKTARQIDDILYRLLHPIGRRISYNDMLKRTCGPIAKWIINLSRGIE